MEYPFLILVVVKFRVTISSSDFHDCKSTFGVKTCVQNNQKPTNREIVPIRLKLKELG